MGSNSLAPNSLAGILNWSTKLPLWQRDALRRIVEQGELSDADYDELTDFCSRDAGIPAVDQKQGPVALDSSAAASFSDSSQSISLLQLSQVQNCNVICDKQTLIFGEIGLTIVFGYNGSGKSGYGRVLRRACRSRHKDSAPILPNVLKPAPKQPASAEITFAVDGEVQSPSQWIEGQKYDELLRNISFFDSNCARVHVGQKNDIAFRPQSLCILEGLAQALSKVKVKLDERKARLTAHPLRFSPTNSPSRDSTVGRFIATLSVKSDVSLLESLPQLSESQLLRLKAIPIELASDPVKQANAKRTHAGKVSQLQQITSRLYESLCDTASTTLKALGQAWKDKQAAADIAASLTFEDEPIPHVGSAAWRKLWEAAREFSKADAYPADPFPNINDGSNCLLCHQRLANTATDRLTRFESFVQDTTAKDAEAAKRLFQSTVAHLEQCGRSVRNGHCRQRLRDFAEIAPDAAAMVRTALAAMLRQFRTVLKQCEQADFVWADSPIEQLNPVYDSVKQTLENDAIRLEALADPEARIKLQAELTELQDRVWLGTVRSDVQIELARLILVAQLEIAGKLCNTNTITTYSKKVAKEHLNDALRLAFANELRRLNEGIRRVEVELEATNGRQGTPYYQVRLIGAKSADVPSVLSEGEHRCIALAGFLAELAMDGGQSAIVFDDPVTSLDHLWRASFARRIVQESVIRQVIVFKHDVALLNTLQDEATKQSAMTTLRRVKATGKASGVVSDDLPRMAQNCKQRLDALDQQVNKLRTCFDEGDEDTYADAVSVFFSRLRATLERIVEEVFYSGIVQRHRDYIAINPKFIARACVITKDDWDGLSRLHKECCDITESHDRGELRGFQNAPNPDDIRIMIDSLCESIRGIRSRQSSAEATV